MKKDMRKFKRASKFSRVLFILVSIGYLISYIFFAKSMIKLTGIETIIRYVILVLLLVYFCFYMFNAFTKLSQKKYTSYVITTIISIILILIFSFSSSILDLVYSKISDFNEDDEVVYTSYLITLKDTILNSKSTLGMIDDEDDIEGNVLANKIIKKNKLKYEINEYETYLDMLYDLYDEKIDGVFVSGNYITLYSAEDSFINIASDTKIVYKLSEKMKNEDSLLTSTKSLDEPFTVLILGVDSEANGLNANAAFNGDTLILATFNPKTYNATLFSIPRDTYVPIACRKGAKYKINSSAAYGTSCVIDTIEDLTDITIDYYVKINFKGVVDLVESLGGVEVDVEEPDYSFNHGNNCKNYVCEQDSNRWWGEFTVYISPGVQTLNGEQALAYARNRGQYIESDLARNRHQQDVIMAIAKKSLSIKSYNQFKNVLDSVSNNISTNMSTNQILSSYKIFKEMLTSMLTGDEFLAVERTYLEVYNLPVYVASSNMTVSALGYYESSLEEIVNAMKVNLELEKPEIIKEFTYSLTEDYESKIIGQGSKKGSVMTTLESFISSSKEEAKEYCDDNNLNCTFTYVDENSQYYNGNIGIDQIVYQNPTAGSLLEDTKSVHFYINGKSATDE